MTAWENGIKSHFHHYQVVWHRTLTFQVQSQWYDWCDSSLASHAVKAARPGTRLEFSICADCVL
eukprot:882485-Amphidinium_carterae.1